MTIFSEPEVIELFDGLSAAFLGAAAACRARNLGATHSGALALGCLCGLFGVLARELVLHGAQGARLVLSALPDDAFIGSAGAVFILLFFLRFGGKIFFWLDALSLGLASSLGAILALPELGIVGALVVGLINGLTPGLARDVALGDTAALVEKEWYAAAAMLGCVLAMAICAAPVFFPVLAEARIGEWALISGALIVCAARYYAARKEKT